MKLLEHGKNTSKVEILNVSPHGVWLYVQGKEYFLSYAEFPWFKDARLSEIEHVNLMHQRYLRWEELDVDLALDSLGHLDRYPLKYK